MNISEYVFYIHSNKEKSPKKLGRQDSRYFMYKTKIFFFEIFFLFNSLINASITNKIIKFLEIGLILCWLNITGNGDSYCLNKNHIFLQEIRLLMWNGFITPGFLYHLKISSLRAQVCSMFITPGFLDHLKILSLKAQVCLMFITPGFLYHLKISS